MHLIRGSIIILLAGLLAGCNENSIASCDPDDWCAGPEPVTDGLNTVTSEGRIREFYVQLPADYETSIDPKPVIFAYHGTGGNYNLWLDGFYDLVDAVGDGAPHQQQHDRSAQRLELPCCVARRLGCEGLP